MCNCPLANTGPDLIDCEGRADCEVCQCDCDPCAMGDHWKCWKLSFDWCGNAPVSAMMRRVKRGTFPH